jgi:hypothetical protein
MKKSLISLFVIFCVATLCYANDYSNAIGLRGGFYNGITVKHFIKDNVAVEGILASRWRGFEITGLYEIHKPAFDTERLHWYYGGGAHIGFWNGNYVNWGTTNTSYVVVGIDGILGIEYNFAEFPVNISLDWKPAFNIIGYSGFWGDGGAFSIRYLF